MESQAKWIQNAILLAFSGLALVFALLCPSYGIAQGITFSVGPDETLSYPSTLTDLADEHTTIIPPAPGSDTYRFFASSAVKGGSGGTVVLETTDLTNFTFASGYPTQVMRPAIAFTSCKTTYDPEFDLNYAAAGSVVQDPTLPPGNLIMIYEAENHCPGTVWQHDFYATVGFARSSDNGKTWPDPVDSALGGTNRYPVLKNPTPQPTTTPAVPQAIGNAIPSAIAVTNGNLESYLYVTYGAPGPGADGMIRVARAKLGASGQISFLKWYQGAFTEPGIGGRDSAVLPSRGCTGRQGMSQISYSETLGLYVMVFACVDVHPDSTGASQAYQASWYFSTATSLELQDWTPPELIVNSQLPIVNGCASDGTGQSFDGWYPSLMSPGVAAGHISNTGKIFYMNGCDRGKRQFMSRTFTIIPPVPRASTQPVYRFYNTIAGGHFFTISEAEKAAVINNFNFFRYEGVGFYASPVQQSGTLPVYRFYNTIAGGHFFTLSESEKAAVINNFNFFRYEGVGFYASPVQQSGTLPVYRFYNTIAGGHFFTLSESEKTAVINNFNFFRYEGVGFYAYPSP